MKYVDEDGSSGEMEVPLTFADFALTEGRFRKHFRKAPPETWNDDMVPLAEFLDLDEDGASGSFPYIWATDAKNRLMRVLVAQELVRSPRSGATSGAS
jgi:pyruvate-ferredoxin/flavodoxin oxidoreductase